MYTKRTSGKSLYRKEQSYRKRLYHISKYIEHEKYVARNVNVKDASGETEDGNSKPAIGDLVNGHP